MIWFEITSRLYQFDFFFTNYCINSDKISYNNRVSVGIQIKS